MAEARKWFKHLEGVANVLVINRNNCPVDGYQRNVPNCEVGIPVFPSSLSSYGFRGYPSTNLYKADGTHVGHWGPTDGKNQAYDPTAWPDALTELQKLLPPTDPCLAKGCTGACKNVYGAAQCFCGAQQHLGPDRKTCRRGALLQQRANGVCLTADGTQPGDAVSLSSCDSTQPSQLFEYDNTTNFIKNKATGLCIEAEYKLRTLSMQACVVDKKQAWSCNETGLLTGPGGRSPVSYNGRLSMLSTSNGAWVGDQTIWFQAGSDFPVCDTTSAARLPVTEAPSAAPTRSPPSEAPTAKAAEAPGGNGEGISGATLARTSWVVMSAMAGACLVVAS